MKLYTKPIVCKYKGGWFVFFRYWDGEKNKYQPRKISRANGQDLNRIKNLKERSEEFEALRDAREIWLQRGWNPIRDPEFQKRFTDNLSPEEYKHIGEWPLRKALEHGLKTKKLKKKQDYQTSLNYFLDAAKQIYVDYIPVKNVTQTLVKAVFSILSEKLQPKNYNKRLNHIKSILTELREWQAIEQNPAHGLRQLHVETTQKFIPLTKEERAKVREFLFLKHYRFLIFLMTLYYTGIRPDELLGLHISDIDLVNGSFHLQPTYGIVKNKKERLVVIHQKLLEFYRELNLQDYPSTHFIFSKKFEPGTKRIEERHARYVWDKYVRGELSINKYLYAFKHGGADDLIAAGADEQSVSDHLGHSSIFMTRRYTQKGIEQSRNVIKNVDIEF